MITNTITLRKALGLTSNDSMIIAHEFLSQPDSTLTYRIKDIKNMNECALTLATPRDIVILDKLTTPDYYNWLMRYNLTTENLIILNSKTNKTLPKLIIRNKTEIKDKIKEIRSASKSSGRTIYIPRFCNYADYNAAKSLNIDILGCKPSLILKFYNKYNFKQLCKEHNIPVIESVLLDFKNKRAESYATLKELVKVHKALVMKDLTSSAGANFTTITRKVPNINNIPHKIFSVEKIVKVEKEFTTQAIITGNGEIKIIDTSQILAKNFKQFGNKYLTDKRVIQKLHKLTYDVAYIMKSQGFKGIFGLDIIKTNNKYYISENNTRLNGSLYAWEILKKIIKQYGPVKHALYLNFSLPVMPFNIFISIIEGLIYNGKNKHCIFPINVTRLKTDGKISLLITGKTMKQVKEILKTLEVKGIKSNFKT